MRDIFQDITDRILGQIDQGVRPWSQPWSNKRSVAIDLPHNIAGRPYRGANVFWLWAEAQAMGYTHPVWLTYKQAEAAGGHVRKGEKSTPVFFWKFPNAAENKEREKQGLPKRGPMVKTYFVFNIAQCDGVTLPEAPAPLPEPERIAAAEALIAATGADIRHGGNKAFFSPAFDRVQLPERDQFADADSYYSTAFHELGHWTGHASRLNREFGKKFGDNAYAFEELVAELTAAFVCASQGFASIERPDHAGYLKHWMEVMKADKGAFIKAAGEAQKAADLIMGVSFAKGETTEGEGEAAPALAQAA